MQRIRVQHRCKRIRVKFDPQFQGVFERYARKVIRRNMWRLNRVTTLDDMMQEAYLIFDDVVRIYVRNGDVDNPRWLMELFKTSLSNHIHDVSRNNTKSRESQLVEADPDSRRSLIAEIEDNEGMIYSMVRDAPEEVREVLTLFLNCPREVMDMIVDAWRARGKRKALGNEHLCAMLGKDPRRVDLISEVESYFLE